VWIDKHLPALRRHRHYGLLVSLGLIAATILGRTVLSGFPPFLPFFPVVLLSTFLGGRKVGIIAWAACTLLGAYFYQTAQADPYPDIRDCITVTSFSAICALIVFIVGLLDQSIERLQRERQRLDLALKAANLATWELRPGGELRWDDNFFRMVGIDPEKEAPTVERFVAMVHPEDRIKMIEGRHLMNQGIPPQPKDEYRLTRPDGRVVWLENCRTTVSGDDGHFIGITQNISERKRTEMRIKMLMRELAHRVKNQYSVILAMVRETRKQSHTSEEFERLVHERITALSRSHDLLVHGNLESADLLKLLFAHTDAFGVTDRVIAEGPPVSLTATAAQYVGMAFHELATNAVKHGAFSVSTGRVSVTWSVSEATGAAANFLLKWEEQNGPTVGRGDNGSTGFGSKVLQSLAPTAMSGIAEMSCPSTGLIWRLKAPAESVLFAHERELHNALPI